MARNNLILFGFLLLKIALQYSMIDPVYDLHRDEYLHLDQARHLAWGYMSVPPVTSWISSLIALLGNGVFWVKFFPALFGALTMVVVWKTVEALGGGLFARMLGAVAVLFSVIVRLNILFQPNSLDILLWTLCYYAVVQYIRSEQPKWLYGFALAFALGFLNKYNIAFLLMGLVPAMLFTEQRKIFLSRHFWLAVLVALVTVSPNLFWQYQNGFPVFRHLNELAQTQLENVNRADFLREQLLFFIGSIFVLAAALVAFFRYAPFRQYRLFFWSFVATLSIFVYFRAKGYYAIGLYPVLLAFGAVYLGHLLQDGWKRYLRPVALAIPVLLFIPLIPLVFPVHPPERILQDTQPMKDIGLLRWEDGQDHHLPQDFADMLGWKELAQKVDSAWQSIGDSAHTLVLCDNYGQAGAINYYSKFRDIRAVSFNADYINWFPLDREIRHVILVKESDDPEKEKAEEKALFESVRIFGAITDPNARESGTTIYILQNATADINRRLEKEILEERGDR